MARAGLPPHRSAQDRDDLPADSCGTTAGAAPRRASCSPGRHRAAPVGRSTSATTPTSPGGDPRRRAAPGRSWSTRSAPGTATALISHEFFAAASRRAGRRAPCDAPGAEVHVVVTARDTLGLVTPLAGVREERRHAPHRHYPAREDDDPHDEWGWGSFDLADVLDRWGAAVPPERVHVLPLPDADEPARPVAALRRGARPRPCRAATRPSAAPTGRWAWSRSSCCAGSTPSWTGFDAPVDRGVWIRGYLAEGKLVPRRGERFWPSDERVDELRARGDRAVAEIAAAGLRRHRRPCGPAPTPRTSRPRGTRRRHRGRADRGRHGDDR